MLTDFPIGLTCFQISRLNCTKQYDIGPIDYMGNWNERPWGTADWTKKFKKAMEGAGFANTQIIILSVVL